MKSEYFYCPRCKTKLKKSAAAFVLGEAGRSAAAASQLPFATCPACGADIDTKAMVEGKLDGSGGGCAEATGCLVWLGGVIYLTSAHEFGFWAAVGIATGAALVLALLVLLVTKLFGKS